MLIKNILKSISDTFDFSDKSEVIFLNTGDICEGKILHSNLFQCDLLPGQAKKTIQNNDLLYSEIRPVNRHYALVNVQNPDNYVVSTKLMVLRKFNESYDMNFVYQYLTSDKVIEDLQTIAESRSGTFPQITFEQLSIVNIPDISLSEQQHIVNILGSLDDKIENNEKKILKLELYNQRYFRKNYINNLNYNNWKSVKLEDCVEISRGASPRPIQNYLSSNGMPWVKISDATKTSSNFITETDEFIVDDGIDKSKTVTKGMLIVSNSATPALTRILNITACVHDGWLILENYKLLTKEIIKYIIDYNKQQLISSGNGSVFTNLKTEILKSLQVKIPTKEEVDKLTLKLKINLDTQLSLTEENKTLNNLKQLYLKKFFG